METVVNPNCKVYYSGQYWNEFQRVLEYMCENFTGDKEKWWVQDFKERFCPIPFEHALVLNCGNGWVERELIDERIVRQVTAFDCSLDLLQIGQKEKGDRPILYFQADVNRIDFRDDQFDLIVNVAALHHVQYINRLCRILCKSLTAQGIFVNYDYIGPHRNQYSFLHWFYITRVNSTLPAQIRKAPLIKAHLPTMLYDDPTEAIHSELIIETASRYFRIFERHDSGGGIAYELLTQNPKLRDIPPKELNPHLDKILVLDRKYTSLGKVPPLFSYFLARPNKSVLEDKERMKYFQGIENRREKWSRHHRGTYSYRHYYTMLAHSIYKKLVNSRSGLNRSGGT